MHFSICHIGRRVIPYLRLTLPIKRAKNLFVSHCSSPRPTNQADIGHPCSQCKGIHNAHSSELFIGVDVANFFVSYTLRGYRDSCPQAHSFVVFAKFHRMVLRCSPSLSIFCECWGTAAWFYYPEADAKSLAAFEEQWDVPLWNELMSELDVLQRSNCST